MPKSILNIIVDEVCIYHLLAFLNPNHWEEYCSN